MSHQRWHILEKIQVEIAAVISLVVVFCLAWPFLRPWDPDGAVVFLPAWSWGPLGVFALTIWALAALCALMTVSARPEGALLATLIGAGGVSLHSGNARLLLMRYEDSLSQLLYPLAGEMAAMAAVLAGALAIIHLVRRGVGRVRPGWVRPNSIHPVVRPVQGNPGRGGAVRPAEPTGWGQPLAMSLASGGLTLLIGLLLLIVTFLSRDRGQILFSLAISFFIGAAVAHSFFPSRLSAPYWLAPVLLGTIVYLRATSTSAAPGVGPLWTHLDIWVNALPVDWLTAGCGGAIGGYWLSCRLLDLRRAPKVETPPPQE